MRKKILFLSSMISLVLPIASVVSCASEKEEILVDNQDAGIPYNLNAKHIAFSLINPQNVLGKTDNLNLSALKDKINNSLSQEEQQEKNKIPKYIKKIGPKQFKNMINSSNYNKYLPNLQRFLSSGYTIETYYHETLGFEPLTWNQSAIPIRYALLKNKKIITTDTIFLYGFNIMPTNASLKTTWKDRYIEWINNFEAMTTLKELCLEDMLDTAPDWVLTNSKFSPNLQKLFANIDVRKNRFMYEKPSFYFYQDSEGKVKVVISIEWKNYLYNQAALSFRIQMLKFFINKGQFSRDGSPNLNFIAPEIKTDTNGYYESINWASAKGINVSRRDKRNYEYLAKNYQNLDRKSHFILYSQPIDFKKPTKAEAINKVHYWKTWPKDEGKEFNSLTLNEKKFRFYGLEDAEFYSNIVFRDNKFIFSSDFGHILVRKNNKLEPYYYNMNNFGYHDIFIPITELSQDENKN